MADKGYLKANITAERLQQQIADLEAAHIAHENILIAQTPAPAVESLAAGDVLVVRSLEDCGCGSIHALTALLGDVARRGAYLRSLCDPVLDTREPAPDWSCAAATLSRLESLFRSQRSREGLDTVKKRGLKLGRRTLEKSRSQLGQLLRAYYQSDSSVRRICKEASCSENLLYRVLRQNGLPRRMQVEEDPTLNPFSGGRDTLRIRVDNDYMLITAKAGDTDSPAESTAAARRMGATPEI